MSIESIETKHARERNELFSAIRNLPRRDFFKISAAAMAAAMTAGDAYPHSFTPCAVEGCDGDASGAGRVEAFRFAYISDSHLYDRKINDRFVRSLLRGVDDVNRMDPQPDFVLYGGDLAQLGSKSELELGAQILKSLKAPVKMMVGEHDWYLDMGESWRELFGPDQYSWDHKGVHFVVLNSVVEKDFWTERALTPAERMATVAGLDNAAQNPFTVGAENRAWLAKDLEALDKTTPIVVFSHSPLYEYYPNWNFTTQDWREVHELLRRFETVTVLHGHTHQLLSNRVGHIDFHGMLSTAWPWPYAPEGLPALTVQMNRADPFNPMDGCGDGIIDVDRSGLIDKVYRLWNRNPVQVSSAYLRSGGKKDRPRPTKLVSY